MLDELDRIIEDNNVQFVEHNVEEFVEDNTISIQFNVFEGEKFLVERIDISGNNITNENVIEENYFLMKVIHLLIWHYKNLYPD